MSEGGETVGHVKVNLSADTGDLIASLDQVKAKLDEITQAAERASKALAALSGES